MKIRNYNLVIHSSAVENLGGVLVSGGTELVNLTEDHQGVKI